MCFNLEFLTNYRLKQVVQLKHNLFLKKQPMATKITAWAA